MTNWIAVGPMPGGAVGYALCGSRVTARTEGKKITDVLENLGPCETVLRIGKGTAAPVPAPVLPKDKAHLTGLEQKNPPDVISAWVRLWIAGFLATRKGWDGVVCATHGDVTHWMHISADEVVSTQSLLTPRLQAALAGSLHASEEALDDTMSRPERLAAHLRQAEVRGDDAAITGHLLGAELAATRPYWLGQQVALLSDTPEAHQTALQAQGVPVTAHATADLIKQGLAAWASALGLSD